MDVEKEPEPQEHEEEEEIDPEEQERREKKKLAVAAKEEGNALYKAHKFDEAIAAYNRAIELDPSEMSFITNRAGTCTAPRRSSMRHLTQTPCLALPFPLACLVSSAVNFQTGKYEECIKDCEEAILVGREHRASFGLIAKALVRIGNAYYKLGNLEGALDAYRRSQTEERSRETAKLINKVEQEKARRDEQAYLNPELSLAAKERGNAFFKEGKYPQAVTEYTEAIKRNPTDPVLYSNRAITYQKLWEFPKALEDCDKALELDPKFGTYSHCCRHSHFANQPRASPAIACTNLCSKGLCTQGTDPHDPAGVRQGTRRLPRWSRDRARERRAQGRPAARVDAHQPAARLGPGGPRARQASHGRS